MRFSAAQNCLARSREPTPTSEVRFFSHRGYSQLLTMAVSRTRGAVTPFNAVLALLLSQSFSTHMVFCHVPSSSSELRKTGFLIRLQDSRSLENAQQWYSTAARPCASPDLELRPLPVCLQFRHRCPFPTLRWDDEHQRSEPKPEDKRSAPQSDLQVQAEVVSGR